MQNNRYSQRVSSTDAVDEDGYLIAVAVSECDDDYIGSADRRNNSLTSLLEHPRTNVTGTNEPGYLLCESSLHRVQPTSIECRESGGEHSCIQHKPSLEYENTRLGYFIPGDSHVPRLTTHRFCHTTGLMSELFGSVGMKETNQRAPLSPCFSREKHNNDSVHKTRTAAAVNRGCTRPTHTAHEVAQDNAVSRPPEYSGFTHKCRQLLEIYDADTSDSSASSEDDYPHGSIMNGKIEVGDLRKPLNSKTNRTSDGVFYVKTHDKLNLYGSENYNTTSDQNKTLDPISREKTYCSTPPTLPLTESSYLKAPVFFSPPNYRYSTAPTFSSIAKSSYSTTSVSFSSSKRHSSQSVNTPVISRYISIIDEVDVSTSHLAPTSLAYASSSEYVADIVDASKSTDPTSLKKSTSSVSTQTLPRKLILNNTMPPTDITSLLNSVCHNSDSLQVVRSDRRKMKLYLRY